MATKRRATRRKTNTETTKKSDSENNTINVGAVWVGETKKGQEFLSLVIDSEVDLSEFIQERRNGNKAVILSAFINQFKEEDKHPDYNIVGFLDN